MKKLVQKILFNRSFLEQQKQILRSALLFLREPIKTDGDSKVFFLPFFFFLPAGSDSDKKKKNWMMCDGGGPT